MTPTPMTRQKSTIVRLSVIIFGAAALAGCGTLALEPRSTVNGQCPADQTLMCETFGPERACACEDRGRVMRQLPSFGHAALGLAR